MTIVQGEPSYLEILMHVWLPNSRIAHIDKKLPSAFKGLSKSVEEIAEIKKFCLEHSISLLTIGSTGNSVPYIERS